jgi:hypothetical protein
VISCRLPVTCYQLPVTSAGYQSVAGYQFKAVAGYQFEAVAGYQFEAVAGCQLLGTHPLATLLPHLSITSTSSGGIRTTVSANRLYI